jgi:hypothetical protein
MKDRPLDMRVRGVRVNACLVNPEGAGNTTSVVWGIHQSMENRRPDIKRILKSVSDSWELK